MREKGTKLVLPPGLEDFLSESGGLGDYRKLGQYLGGDNRGWDQRPPKGCFPVSSNV